MQYKSSIKQNKKINKRKINNWKSYKFNIKDVWMILPPRIKVNRRPMKKELQDQ